MNKRDITADKYWLREINNILENCLGLSLTKLTKDQKEKVVDDLIFDDNLWEIINERIIEYIEEENNEI